MTGTTEQLKVRAQQTRDLITSTSASLAQFDIEVTERVLVVGPLVLASLDTADTMAYLLGTEPERRWVQALALQRVQMEYVLRAAFFAGAASDKEIGKFLRKGHMPKRSKRTIYLLDLVREAAGNLGWQAPKLVDTVKNHHRDLSGLVHGGKELLEIYTMHEVMGDLTAPWDDLSQPLENSAVFTQLALSVLMKFSRLEPPALDAVVRPTYDRSMAYFAERRNYDEPEQNINP